MSSFTFPHDPSRVPDGLKMDAFTIRPLRVEDVELDFDAVMSSRSMLRAWSQSDWPAQAFTLASNLADLERHQREHEAGVAYTYTIMQPDEARCLGCLYIHPVPQELLAGLPAPDREKTISGSAAYARFWVRSSLQGSGFDLQLLKELISWFQVDWSLEAFFLRASPQDAHQLALFASAGLTLACKLVLGDPDLAWLVYA
jgi:RimJ/RimL family protein N-acetyltransferase